MAHAVADRPGDLADRAAPDPVIVVEVRIAFAALRARAVALHAIDLEGGRAAGDGELDKLGIGRDVAYVGGGDALQIDRLRLLGALHVLGQLAARGPAQNAGRGAGDAGPG